jgi:hypothetical protein
VGRTGAISGVPQNFQVLTSGETLFRAFSSRVRMGLDLPSNFKLGGIGGNSRRRVYRFDSSRRGRAGEPRVVDERRLGTTSSRRAETRNRERSTRGDEKPRAGSDERRRGTASGVRREETRNRELDLPSNFKLGGIGGNSRRRVYRFDSSRRGRAGEPRVVDERRRETASRSTRGDETRGDEEPRVGSDERRPETASRSTRGDEKSRAGSTRGDEKSRAGSTRGDEKSRAWSDERRRETASGVRREETRNRVDLPSNFEIGGIAGNSRRRVYLFDSSRRGRPGEP